MPQNDSETSSVSGYRFTDARLGNAKSKDKPYKISVGGGLYLGVMPSGSKFWRWKFRLNGKESRHTLGDYPKTGLKEATRLADEARDMVKSGLNPSRQRELDRIQQSHESRNTVDAVALAWLEMKEWEPRTKARRESLLTRCVFPFIGTLPVRQVKPAHVLDILQRAERDNGPAPAAEIKRTLSGVFSLAIATLRAESDPVAPVAKSLKPAKTRHKRPLSADEIGQFLRDLDGYSGNFQIVMAVKLQWLTLCHPSEAIGAEWSEFDLPAAVWRIPAKRMKMRDEHIIPLPRRALAIVQAMKPITGNCLNLFPHRDHRDRAMTDAAVRELVVALGWRGKFSLHATRVTGSTHLNGMGYAADWIERQLAHKDKDGVRRTYNQAQYLEDRRRMMQVWGDYLDGLKAGADVIPFRKQG